MTYRRVDVFSTSGGVGKTFVTIRLAQLQAQVMDLAGRIYTVGRHKSALIKGLKCALSLLGICDDCMAEPFHKFREPERAQIREHLIALGLLPS